MKKNIQIEKINKLIKEIQKYRKKDFTYSSGHILGSMCTIPHPIVKHIYLDFIDTNLGDPELFPGTKEIEKKYIDFLKKLFHAPKNSFGINGSGGTESNITATWLAKKINKKREIIAPESAHFSFEKIASLMDIKIKYVKLNKNYSVDINDLKKKISNNTSAVVGIAGSTELGTIDDIAKLSDICYDNNIFLHVDAAFGGYVIPFLTDKYKNYEFDFNLKGVSSISVDAHKMGHSAIPLGTLMIRKKNWIHNISVKTPYISSKTQSGLLATRCGAPVVAAYSVIKLLGFNGYKNLIKQCMNNTYYCKKRFQDIGLNIIIEPVLNVIGIKLKNPKKVVELLTKAGWKVNYLQRFSAIRIVLMPHVSRENIDDFLPVFKKVCKKLGEI